ncbi:recombinase [Falsiroseomonas sp.]|uniref:recombinase n=1 Tax=Falsiroseomonas sp. TaxID=2870721 RepID=UPI0027279DAB|nr:recombinase [Falsiroseomonas sp.]MDO9499947.1 recombinase [Falsiroseomonas sp.]
MDGSLPGAPALRHRRIPGARFGGPPAKARALDAGMGLAVARRTVFRPSDAEDFGRVADRVAAGNMALLGDRADRMDHRMELSRLRNAIATGALITSGRHLQHGDADQPRRNMEVFTNCATAAASFSLFYLLLNGSGVGRAYDDELMAVDWAQAPNLLLHLGTTHADFPASRATLHRFGLDFSLLPWGTSLESMTEAQEADLRGWIAREFVGDTAEAPADAIRHVIDDSREGWGKAVELLESLAFEGAADRTLLLDFSAIRPCGAPIGGMQGRPASGPLSLMRAFVNLRAQVIAPARRGTMQPWEQAMLVDHHLSVEVQVGGARRAARMATKSWRDPGILRFIRVKSEGGLWTANNSVMVDAAFWDGVRAARAGSVSPLDQHAFAVFEEATRCGYINGEPGFINGDKLEDHRTGTAWDKPVHEDGRDVRSARYQADHAVGLLAEIARRAGTARFPATTNPCGEITLHVTGGYCVIADFAPLLACPVDYAALTPGEMPADVAEDWDARVEDSVRLGVRFLMRANLMDALYGAEVARTNRMGIGPTGLHEWAWMRYGLGFAELLDQERSSGFWTMLDRLSAAAKEEADSYAQELGLESPHTVTTVKPAGTTSKLFGLTEGAHLPARRHYLRWVQFKGVRAEDGGWTPDSDRLLAEYEARGYPIRSLSSFPGMSIVGFPTLSLIERLGLGEKLVTAPEASPEAQYRWLSLLERHWIGAERGNQVSYTLKIYTDQHDIADFRDMVLTHQPQIRCCAILPSRPDNELGYEYLPEEEVTPERFLALVAGINDPALHEAVDGAHLQCASGVCPI